MPTVYKTTADGVYKTLDSGSTWADVTPESGYQYVDLVKKSNNTAYVLGTKDTAGTFSTKIWKTVDSGTNWPTSAVVATSSTPLSVEASIISYGSAMQIGNYDMYGIGGTRTGQTGMFKSAIGMSEGRVVLLRNRYIGSASISVGPEITVASVVGDIISSGSFYQVCTSPNGLAARNMKIKKVDDTHFTVVWTNYDDNNGKYNIGLRAGVLSGGTGAAFGDELIITPDPTQSVFNVDVSPMNTAGEIAGNKFALAYTYDPNLVVAQVVNYSMALGDLTEGPSAIVSSATCPATPSNISVEALNDRVFIVAFSELISPTQGYVTACSYVDPNTINIGASKHFTDAASQCTRYGVTVIDETSFILSYVAAIQGLGTTKLASANLTTLDIGITDTRYFSDHPTKGPGDYTITKLNDAPSFIVGFRSTASGVDQLRLAQISGSVHAYIAEDFAFHGTACGIEMSFGMVSDAKILAYRNLLDPIDDVMSLYTIYLASSGGGVSDAKGIGLGVSGNQKNAYVTYSDGENLKLASLSATDLATIRTTSLGAGTPAQAASNIRVAYPRTTSTENDRVWAIGRMIDPAGLSASPTQIILSDDGGTTFSSYQNGWGNDFCGAAYQKKVTGSLFSVRNFTDTAQSAFYQNKLARGAIPFNVHHRAMFINMDDVNSYAIVGGSNVQDTRVYYAGWPFSRWYDVTKNYPNAASSNGGAITGVTVVG